MRNPLRKESPPPPEPEIDLFDQNFEPPDLKAAREIARAARGHLDDLIVQSNALWARLQPPRPGEYLPTSETAGEELGLVKRRHQRLTEAILEARIAFEGTQPAVLKAQAALAARRKAQARVELPLLLQAFDQALTDAQRAN